MAFEQETEEEAVHHGASQADLIGSYLAFAGRAVRSRRLLAAFIFLGVSALAIGIISILPRTYHCEMKSMIESTDRLTRSDRGVGFKGAPEAILRHDNLEAVVKQTELAKSWPLTRPPFMKLKDKIWESLRGSMSESDLEAMLVATLETKFNVTATDSTNTLAIGVDWHDPRMAAQLVDAAYQRYLETRHGADVSSIAEYISILEGHASELRQEIETIAEQIVKTTDEKGDKKAAVAAAPSDTPPVAAAPVRRSPPRIRMPDEELPRVKAQLELKQSTLKQLQDDRKRRVIELEARLTEAKARYTPAHPVVLD